MALNYFYAQGSKDNHFLRSSFTQETKLNIFVKGFQTDLELPFEIMREIFRENATRCSFIKDFNLLCDLQVIGRLSKIMHNFNIHYMKYVWRNYISCDKTHIFEDHNVHLKNFNMFKIYGHYQFLFIGKPNYTM